jgi:hypothetical protein
MAVPCFYWAFQVCGDSDQIDVDLSYAAFRWAVGQTSAPAMISAERASEIVSTLCCVARVLLHRNAGSSSWRRKVYRKGLSVPSEDILNNLSLLYFVPLIVRYQLLCRSQQSLVRIVLVGVFGAYHGQGGSSEGGLDDVAYLSALKFPRRTEFGWAADFNKRVVKCVPVVLPTNSLEPR